MSEGSDRDSDQSLVEKAQAGNFEAFGLLASKYKKRVYDIAYNFTRNTEEAYDLSQEIFLKAFRALKGFESKSSFYTWLYRIARNAGVDYTRRKNNRPEYLFPDDFPADESLLHPRVTNNSVVHPVEAAEIDNEIKKAISELSPRQQQVFVLRYYEDLPLSEIADILELKVGSIKAHLFNAIRNLRKHLEHYIAK